MRYDYGPIRLSPIRGLILTFSVPLFVAGMLAAFNAFTDEIPFSMALGFALDDLRELYQRYKVIALALHAAFFVKGLMYRRRYVTFLPQLVTLSIVAGLFWILSLRVGLDPRAAISEALSSTSSAVSARLGGDSEGAGSGFSSLQRSPGEAIQPPAPPVNPIALPQDAPNMLRQTTSRIPQSVLVMPDATGSFLVAGHVGNFPAVHLLNAKSPYSAAPFSMASSVTGTCKATAFMMDGKSVSGCVGFVDDLDLGPIQLPRTKMFFSRSMTGTRVFLGANALAHLSIDKNTNGSIQVAARGR